MKNILKKAKQDLIFLPLGGTDEIGMNFYLYHYMGKWIIVDLGLGFADERFPGIDLLVPDIEFLEHIKKDILGIIITHAHEDHIGAIQYLWNEIRVPIYATPFTCAVVKNKLFDMGFLKEVTINQVQLNSSIKLGDFDIEFFQLTHSVPEMSSLIIRTAEGNIFHTGDWKFDHDPVLGMPVDKKRLKALAKEGVLAMVCDSTNIFSDGVSGSEGDLRKSLQKVIAEVNKNQLIVVSTFASNVARLHSLMEVAQSIGRKVVFCGTSVWRMYRAALDTGYLSDLPEPIPSKEIKRYKKSEIMVVATGCQGEYFAAVTKMARDDHPDIKLSKGDTVIFSSKIIPGNEKKIFALFNKMCKKGIEVLTEKDHFVHVSGHPSRDEVAEMYKLVKPKYAIPMHGEPMHIHEHLHFVKQRKLGEGVLIENGDILKISNDGCKVLAKADTGYLAIDGNQLLPQDTPILKMRKRLRDQGVVIITIAIDNTAKLLCDVEILAPGVLDIEEDTEYFDELTKELTHYLKNNGARGDLDTKLKSVAKRFFKQHINKEPKIFVQVMKIGKK